jgi:hypothetical protein
LAAEGVAVVEVMVEEQACFDGRVGKWLPDWMTTKFMDLITASYQVTDR